MCQERLPKSQQGEQWGRKKRAALLAVGLAERRTLGEEGRRVPVRKWQREREAVKCVA